MNASKWVVVISIFSAPLLFPAAIYAQDAGRGGAARCIAVTLPVVEGMTGNATEVANGVRDLMVSYLTGPTLKVVVLEAKLPSQAPAEAQQKGCEPLLYLSMTKKSGGGGLARAIGQAAGSSSYYLPGGASIGTAAARAASVAGLQTAANLASGTKAKDEIRLEYRLQSTGGKNEFGPNTERQTAKADGEDLLTPVVMRAADAIVSRKPAR